MNDSTRSVQWSVIVCVEKKPKDITSNSHTAPGYVIKNSNRRVFLTQSMHPNEETRQHNANMLKIAFSQVQSPIFDTSTPFALHSFVCHRTDWEVWPIKYEMIQT